MDRVGDPSSPRVWRLIESGPGDGWHNMAVDPAIHGAHSLGLVPPTLRLYTWKRPTLSLGRFQDAGRGIDLGACADLGVHVVRRPTGGRAILHTDDVTYSFVCRYEFLLNGTSVVASYKEISVGLGRALRIIGLEATLGRSGRRDTQPQGADCFASLSLADLAVGGLKVVGSAQSRHGGVILQQGTIPLGRKPKSLGEVFAGDRACGAPAAPGLEAVAGRRITQEEMLSALKMGFAEVLSGSLVPGSLVDEELESAASDLCPLECFGDRDRDKGMFKSGDVCLLARRLRWDAGEEAVPAGPNGCVSCALRPCH